MALGCCPAHFASGSDGQRVCALLWGSGTTVPSPVILGWPVPPVPICDPGRDQQVLPRRASNSPMLCRLHPCPCLAGLRAITLTSLAAHSTKPGSFVCGLRQPWALRPLTLHSWASSQGSALSLLSRKDSPWLQGSHTATLSSTWIAILAICRDDTSCPQTRSG